MTATYTVGIDLGTTHTVVAYAAAKGRIAEDAIRLILAGHLDRLACIEIAQALGIDLLETE